MLLCLLILGSSGILFDLFDSNAIDQIEITECGEKDGEAEKKEVNEEVNMDDFLHNKIGPLLSDTKSTDRFTPFSFKSMNTYHDIKTPPPEVV